MMKKADTSGLDPAFIIGQGKKSNREQQAEPTVPPISEPEQVSAPVSVEPIIEPEPVPEVKETPKRKRSQPQGYKETFLKRNDIKTRQCVYISYDVHAVIAKLVRALVDTGNDITLGGYIDTVLTEHLQANKEEINEIYRQRQNDLL